MPSLPSFLKFNRPTPTAQPMGPATVPNVVLRPVPHFTRQLGHQFGRSVAWSKRVFSSVVGQSSAVSQVGAPPTTAHAHSGEWRFRSLGNQGYSAQRANGQDQTRLQRFQNMLHTRMLIAGLDEQGRKVGMDLRHKMDYAAHMREPVLLRPFKQMPAARMDLIKNNLAALDQDKSLAFSAISNNLTSSTEELCAALGAAMPLHLLSPSSFSVWAAANNTPLRVQMPGPGGDPIEVGITNLSQFMDLVLGRSGFDHITVLNADSFMQALQQEYRSNPVQGWTTTFSGDVPLSSIPAQVHSAWVDDEYQVFKIRQLDEGMVTRYGVTPRVLKSAQSGQALADQVRQSFEAQSPALPKPIEELFYTPLSSFTQTAPPQPAIKQVAFEVPNAASQPQKAGPSKTPQKPGRIYLALPQPGTYPEADVDALLHVLPNVLAGTVQQRVGVLAKHVLAHVEVNGPTMTPAMMVLIKSALYGVNAQGAQHAVPISKTQLKQAIWLHFNGDENRQHKALLERFVRSAVAMGNVLRTQLQHQGQWPASTNALLALASAPLEQYANPTRGGPLWTPAPLEEGGTATSELERQWLFPEEILNRRRFEPMDFPGDDIDAALETAPKRLNFLSTVAQRPAEHWPSRVENTVAERLVIAGVNSEGGMLVPDLRTMGKKSTLVDSFKRWRAYAPEALGRLTGNIADGKALSLQAKAMLLLSVLPLNQLNRQQVVIQGLGYIRSDDPDDQYAEPVGFSELLNWAKGGLHADLSSGDSLRITSGYLDSLRANVKAESAGQSVVTKAVKQLAPAVKKAQTAMAGSASALAQALMRQLQRAKAGLLPNGQDGGDDDLQPSASRVVTLEELDGIEQDNRTNRINEWMREVPVQLQPEDLAQLEEPPELTIPDQPTAPAQPHLKSSPWPLGGHAKG